MPNSFNAKIKPGKGAEPGAKAGSVPDMKMKTAAWQGVPGKTQPRSRAGGTRKLRQSPKEEGI